MSQAPCECLYYDNTWHTFLKALPWAQAIEGFLPSPRPPGTPHFVPRTSFVSSGWGPDRIPPSVMFTSAYPSLKKIVDSHLQNNMPHYILKWDETPVSCKYTYEQRKKKKNQARSQNLVIG